MVNYLIQNLKSYNYKKTFLRYYILKLLSISIIIYLATKYYKLE